MNKDNIQQNLQKTRPLKLSLHNLELYTNALNTLEKKVKCIEKKSEDELLKQGSYSIGKLNKSTPNLQDTSTIMNQIDNEFHLNCINGNNIQTCGKTFCSCIKTNCQHFRKFHAYD